MGEGIRLCPTIAELRRDKEEKTNTRVSRHRGKPKFGGLDKGAIVYYPAGQPAVG